MNKSRFIQLMDDQLKLIRNEYNLTQDKMAVVLGLSKKTLVEIEKRRSTLGWSGAVTLASIFSNSSILVNSIGEDVEDIIFAIAFTDTNVEYPRTLGGKIWWKTTLENQGFTIQQNILSHHYRLLDQMKRRRIASFVLEEIEAHMEELIKQEV